MHVLVIGASRGVGAELVKSLHERGHDVTALARTTIAHPGVRSIVGDATDPAVLVDALSGIETVIVAIGSKRMDGTGTGAIDICSRATKALLAVMPKIPLIVVSSIGVGQTRDRVPWLVRWLYKTLLKSRLDDKEEQERLVRAFDGPWTIVQPFVLSEGPARGNVFASAEGKTRGVRISRADVAVFVAGLVGADDYIGKSVALSG